MKIITLLVLAVAGAICGAVFVPMIGYGLVTLFVSYTEGAATGAALVPFGALAGCFGVPALAIYEMKWR